MKTHDVETEKISRLFFVYAVPSMIAIAVFSLYTLVDAIFIARACGNAALSAVELCAPLLSLFSCVSVVIGVGGNTLIGISIGKKEKEKADQLFSMTTCVILATGALMGVLLTVFPRRAALLLGADEEVLPYVCDYLRVCGLFAPVYLIGGFWSICLETVGKPALAMIGNIATALSNLLLDYLLIVVFRLGVLGASIASGAAALIGALLFSLGLFGKGSVLHPRRFTLDFKMLGQMLFNGLSEGISVFSTGIVSYAYNFLVMKNGGSDTLAYYTVTLTVVNFIGAVLIGATQGLNPIISVNYGAGRLGRLKETLRTYLILLSALAALTCAAYVLFRQGVASLFGVTDAERLWHIGKAYAPVFLLTPISVVAISFFTAINDAKTSALLSVLRGLAIRLPVILALFFLFGLDGMWYGTTVSELLSLCLCAHMLRRYFKRGKAEQARHAPVG